MWPSQSSGARGGLRLFSAQAWRCRVTSMATGRPLRWYLLVITLASLVPLLIFTSTVIRRNVALQYTILRHGMLNTVQALSLAVDREWEAVRVTLDTLAASEYLDTKDFRTFYALCTRAAANRSGAWIVLYAPSGQQVMNTLRPFGDTLPYLFMDAEPGGEQAGEVPLASPETVRRAFTTGQPVYSDLFIGLVPQHHAVSIDVPVLRHGRVVYVLTMAVFPEVFTRLLQEQNLPDHALSIILDRQGTIIARSREAERFSGQPVAPGLLADVAKGGTGWERAHTWDQTPVYHAYTHSVVTGWTTIIAVQEANISGPITQSLVLWVGGAIFFLGLGIGLALLVAQRVTTPITALAQSVDLVRRGQRFVVPQAAVREVRDLNTVLAVTADAIRQRAEERERRLTAEAKAAERQRAADAIGQLNQELRHVQDELAAELEGMQCLHTLSTTLVQHRDLHRLLEVILDAAIRLSHANKGNVQLLDAATGALYIVAQRGFATPFLEFFNRVSDGVDSYSTAMQRGERVIIEDVRQSAMFTGTPALDVMLAAGARAVQSTPLVSRTGRCLGVFSTHYSAPYRPSDREQRLLDLLAWLAADTIERTQAEEALRESEARFRTMANATPVLIWMSGLDTRYTYFNKGWLDFTGRPLEQELGQGWTAGIHPEDRAQCLATYTAAFAHRQPFEIQYRLRRYDGHYRWLLDRGVPLLHPNGTFSGYIGGCIDISDRLEAEQALQQAHTVLEQRVQERTAELAAALEALHHEMAERARMEAERQRLEEASRRAEHFALLGRLAAGVSHEIRNPLGVIYLHADILEEELGQLPWEYQDQLRPTLDEIKTHLVRIDDLVQDYLSLVRVTTIQRQPHDLGAFIEAFAKELQGELVARGMTLTLEGLGQLGVVALHANTFRRVLLNLVHNAMDAMSQGEGLTLCGRQDASHVTLDLHDTGTGIPAEQLARIFEPLYTTKPGGTGLGLYLVREIVTAHGGEITVQSTVGHGTTFTITLPRVAAQ